MVVNSESSETLAGVTVVELGHSVAAPFASQILGDLGADVWKIEKAEGDDARRWGPPFWEGTSAVYQALNRNKQSVVCDLRDASQVTALQAFIAERADVVLQNLRPGQADSLGLGAKALCAAKSSLIYCNIGAFGSQGPLAQRPGYDPLMQAFSGIISVTGEEGRPPVRVAPSIIDLGTGMWAAIGIVAALHRRQKLGKGGVVDVSLLETAIALMSVPAAQFMASGDLPEKQGSGANGIVPYRAYKASDGQWIMIAAGSDGLFRQLCVILERPQWAADPRFISNPERVRNAPELYRMIEEAIAARPGAHWALRLDEAGIPNAPIQNVEQMLSHPQTRAIGIVQAMPDSRMKLVGLPLSIDGHRPLPRRRPALLGEHSSQMLKLDSLE